MDRTIRIEAPREEDERFAILTIMVHNPNRCTWCKANGIRISEHMDGIIR